jgi:DNA-binding NarL/FixJ family response regulator
MRVSAAAGDTVDGRADAQTGRAGVESLTPREMDLFRLIGKGPSNKEIARVLVLS